MLTIAAPSRMVHVVSPAGLWGTCISVRSCEQFNKADFVPPLRAPICESDGGQGWFSMHAERTDQGHHHKLERQSTMYLLIIRNGTIRF